jgi:hypothetical protein
MEELWQLFNYLLSGKIAKLSETEDLGILSLNYSNPIIYYNIII